MKERTKITLILLVFLAAYLIPLDHPIVQRAGGEAFLMLQEYARKHVLFCLLPAFFIAGGFSMNRQVYVSDNLLIEIKTRRCTMSKN